jgi:hypothetical protein
VRILLPFCRGAPERTFYQDFHQGVSEALRELGHEPIPFSFAAMGQALQEEGERLYRQIEHGRLDAILDLACWGFGLSQFAVVTQHGGTKPIFDVFDIPYAGMLLDQPYNQAINGIRARRLYATYPDMGHPEQMRLVFPELSLHGEIFAPPAVRPGNDRSAARWWSDRDIDVLYVGNFQAEGLERFWHNRANACWHSSYDPGVCDALADAALAEPDRSLHLSVQAAIARLGTLAPGFDFRSQLRAVEWFLRINFRREAVVSLARSGVRMRVIGKGWGEAALPANVELGAETDYDGFFRLAGRAKICLDASTYLDGANDRVFSYALNRAVCFTNAAGYVRRSFGDDGGMRFYSMRNPSELGEKVNKLLARPEELCEAGERARRTVLSSHTWRHRVGDILGGMRPT